MASLGEVKFGISYSGLTKFHEVWDISVIDINLKDQVEEISVNLVQTGQTAIQYPPFQVRSKTGNAFRDKLSEKIVDTICMPPAVAKTIELSARIFRDSGVTVHRDNLPIFFDALPKFKDGKCYNIQVTQDVEGSLRGKFIETSRRELERQIQLAKLYPQSVIYSAQKVTQLNPEQEEIYCDFEGIIYAIDGWVSRFATEASLPPPQNPSLYENIAKEALRKQVKQIEANTLETLLKMKREGECKDFSLLSSLMEAYSKAQAAAIGHEGYAAVMRTVLETFSGNKAPLYKESIEKMATQFANCYKKK